MATPVMDTIVIGCGASGIAALRRLHDAGLQILGLEAADRIGGRIHTVKYNDCYLDLGGAWCHGEKNNIVFDMAKPLNLLDRSESNHTYYLLSDGNLLPNEAVDKILHIVDQEVGNAGKNNSRSISESIRNVSKTNPAPEKDSKLVESIIEWYKKCQHLGGEIDPKTGKSLEGLKEWWVDETEPLNNWKGKGYRTILDLLLNKFPEASKELPITIHLNKEVESIKLCTSKLDLQSGNNLVHILCQDGSMYAAKSVIITLSIGVLKERHSQLFSTPLPVEKINTINNLQYCILDKIYIEFAQPWWPEFLSTFNILWRKEDKTKFTSDERWITEIYGLNTVEYHPNLLLAWICGEGALQMEKTSEEQVKAGVEKLLHVFFNNKFKLNSVKSIMRSQWASNPLTRGSYFYRSVYTEENNANSMLLSDPLYRGDSNFPLVCFGGDATSHRRPNGVHGAVEAGFREADRLIACFKEETK